MQALTLPASRGWHWLSDGFRLFRKSPLMLSLLVLSYWMLMLVINAVPFLGQVAATLLLPVFSVSLMNVCRVADKGGTLQPQLLFSGFKRGLRPLFVLGAIYFAAALVILGISALIDGGSLFSLFTAGRTAADSDGALVAAAQFALILFAPLVMAYWYAPVLVGWHDLPAGKALFFSFVACARNWRPFLVYSLAVLVFVAFVPGLLVGVVTVLAQGSAGFVAKAFYFLAVAVIAPTLYASFYISYRDVFVVVDENA